MAEGVPPSPAARKRARAAPDCSPARPVVPAAPPKPAIKLNVALCIRPADRHLSLKFHYINDANKFVPKPDCEPILNEFTAMQRLDWIHLHTKERFKIGEHNVKEHNPNYAYYPGYGNHKGIGEETLPAARCVEVTVRHLREKCSEHINKFLFTSVPEVKGDPMVTYEDEEAFIAFIKTIPDPVEEEDDEEPVELTWKQQVEQRLAALEKAAGFSQLPSQFSD